MPSKSERVLIGICGRSCSGKSTIALEIAKQNSDVTVIHQDKFFKKKTPARHKHHDDWEGPEALRIDDLIRCLKKLKAGEIVYVPAHRFTEVFDKEVNPTRIVIVEGHLLFADKRLADLFDKKIFLEVSDCNILYRRLKREQNIHGLEYIKEVVIERSHEFNEHQKVRANLIIDANQPIPKIVKQVTAYLKL